MPATIDSAPPRTPAAQPLALSPWMARLPPPAGMAEALTATQPPKVPALEAPQVTRARATTAAPSTAMAPPAPAARHCEQNADVTSTLEAAGARAQSSAPDPPVLTLNADSADSCAVAKACSVTQSPLAAARTAEQATLTSAGCGRPERKTAAPVDTAVRDTATADTSSVAPGSGTARAAKTPQPPPEERTQPATVTSCTRMLCGRGAPASVTPGAASSVMQTAQPLPPPATDAAATPLTSATAMLFSRTPTPQEACAAQRGGSAAPTEVTLEREMASTRA